MRNELRHTKTQDAATTASAPRTLLLSWAGISCASTARRCTPAAWSWRQVRRGAGLSSTGSMNSSRLRARRMAASLRLRAKKGPYLS